jgi:tellurite resistance protein
MFPPKRLPIVLNTMLHCRQRRTYMFKSSLRLDARIVSEELKAADNDYRQDVLFEAVVTVGALVAVSDGAANQSERDELVHFVGSNARLGTYTPHETADAFDSRVREFQQVGGVANALNDLRRVADGEGVRTVIAAGERIAAADGDVGLAEATSLRLIRRCIAPA